jgi:hypothetical protein
LLFAGGESVVAKVSGRTRGAFLRAFARTGSVTLAAARAGLSRSWVFKARRADPGFDAECRAAKAASVERLGQRAGNRPPPGWARQGGAELMVTKAGKAVRSAGPWQWTPRAEARFLGALRLCGNQGIACDRVGMTESSLEAHLRRWPDFRRRVGEARAFAGLLIEAEREAAWDAPIDAPELLEPEPARTIDEIIRHVARHISRRGG